jgi:hypothetical protein
LNNISPTNIVLKETTVNALASLREAFGAVWPGNQFAANGAIVLLTELATAELKRLAPFDEVQAFWLVAHTRATSEAPRALGRLLHDCIDDSVYELGEPDATFRERIAALTITQDWALRMTLARYHSLHRQNPDVTLREVGFPVA